MSAGATGWLAHHPAAPFDSKATNMLPARSSAFGSSTAEGLHLGTIHAQAHGDVAFRGYSRSSPGRLRWFSQPR
jgi:hypothetical protein